MKEKCIGCPWGVPTLSDEDGIPYQVFCLPHIGGCDRSNVDELERTTDRTEE